MRTDWVTVSDDDEGFFVRFRESDLIQFAQKYPVREIYVPLCSRFVNGRVEDSASTRARIDAATFHHPIILFTNSKGEIFAIGDGTHRLQKAVELGLKRLEAYIVPAKDVEEAFR